MNSANVVGPKSRRRRFVIWKGNAAIKSLIIIAWILDYFSSLVQNIIMIWWFCLFVIIILVPVLPTRNFKIKDGCFILLLSVLILDRTSIHGRVFKTWSSEERSFSSTLDALIGIHIPLFYQNLDFVTILITRTRHGIHFVNLYYFSAALLIIVQKIRRNEQR